MPTAGCLASSWQPMMLAKCQSWAGVHHETQTLGRSTARQRSTQSTRGKHSPRRDGWDEALQDALADLLHWAGTADFNKALRLARMHYGAEHTGIEVGSRVVVREHRCIDDGIVGTVVEHEGDTVAVLWDSIPSIRPGSKADTETLEPIDRLKVQS